MPYYVSLDLTDNLIREITAIVFDYPSQPIQACDVIFVFGGSHPGLWQTAAEAYHKGLGKVIIATGGHKPGVQPHSTWIDGLTPESHVIKRELVKLLVPEECIVCEDKSVNSLENALFAKKVYDFSAVRSILVVCKCYGVGRQCRTLKQQMDNAIVVIPYPFDTESSAGGPIVMRDNWMNYRESKALVFSQALKIYRYGKAGHLQPFEHISPKLEELLERHAVG